MVLFGVNCSTFFFSFELYIEHGILELFDLGQLTFQIHYVNQKAAVLWDQRYLTSQIPASEHQEYKKV